MTTFTARDKVLEAIRRGRLPGRSPNGMWAGRGSGVPCAVCGERIAADEVEFELEFGSGDDGGPPAVYTIDRACFLAWDCERRNLESKDATKALEASGAIEHGRPATDEQKGSV